MADPPKTHAELCHAIAARARTCALATLAEKPDTYPYASLVNVAWGAEGRAILLLSALAEHTQNLVKRPEASLLVVGPEEPDRDSLASPRMTLIGPCARIPDDETLPAREVYLVAHPAAARYLALKDFAFFALRPIGIRYVGGFGAMSWVPPEEYAAAWR